MLQILYADQQIAVCVKPAGILSQDAGEQSMPHLLRRQLNKEYIGVVHRLDREVGGVMVYALTPNAAASLSRSIQERTMEKVYQAVLLGIPEAPSAVLEDMLFHDKNRNKTYVVERQRQGVKDASLDYEVLQSGGGWTLVKVRLHTGRTHQIRVQFASRKLPLVGDRKYGGKQPGVPLCLWAWKLTFPHPATGRQMTFMQEPEWKEQCMQWFTSAE